MTFVLVCIGGSALADTVFVWQSSPSPAPPYSSWDTAATSIVQAVSYANTHPECTLVLVTNGTYVVTQRVEVTNAYLLQSVTGPHATTIQGSGIGEVVLLGHSQAAISGFTITGGNGGSWDFLLGGGGVGCSASSAVVTNCIIRNNFATHYGGGVYGGTVIRCVIVSNVATRLGGGLYNSKARNCLIAYNMGGGEGGGGGMYGGVAENCTIASNTAWRSDTSYQQGGGTHSTIVTNSIVFFNYGAAGYENWYGGSFAFSCANPLPPGQGNISQDPNFVNRLAGNYHLGPSPCVDAGTNLSWMSSAQDLDGSNRISNGRVDMGCYEADYANGPLICTFSGTPLAGLDQVQTVFTAMTAGSNTAITAYSWNFGDGNTACGPTLSVATNTYTNVGAYNVTLTVTNTGNETASITYSNYVTVAPRVLYVSPDGGDQYPYDSWAKAAKSIQSAVYAAYTVGTNRATVLVTNGTYSITTQVLVDKPITVASVNGPSVTRVVRTGGNQRIFELRDPGACVCGFLIENGTTDGSYNYAGGGVYCYYSSAVVSNCVLLRNYAEHFGGAVYGGIVVNSLAISNTSRRQGGAFHSSVARNCLIACNMGGGEGGGGGMYGGVAENCTIASNTSWRSDTGYQYGGGTHSTIVTNSIIYFNKGLNESNDNWYAGSYAFVCSTPLPPGFGNIASDPGFQCMATQNFHLADSSPCIGTGTNLPWMTASTDLDGRRRLVGGRVDMGCYEWSPRPGTVIFVR